MLLALAVQAQSFRMETPYEMENGKMLVRACVNGVEGRFLLDTGAPVSFTYTFAQRAGISGGIPQRGYDSNGNVVEMQVVDVPQLQVGGVTFTRLQAMRMEQGNMAEQFGIDGIIGYNLFRQGVLKLDGRHCTAVLCADTASLGADPNCAIVMVPDRFMTLLPVRLGEQRDTVMFDTGASAFYEMSSASYARLHRDTTAHLQMLASGRGTLSMGAAGVEQASEKHRLRVSRFGVGNVPFADVTTVTTDAYNSRMGSELLNYGDVIIDFREGMFYFQPYAPDSVPQMYRPEWDVVVVVEGNHLVAGMVWDNAVGNIRQGDRILAIGDKRIGEVNLHEATTQNLFNLNPNGTRITYLSSVTGKEESMIIRMK